MWGSPTKTDQTIWSTHPVYISYTLDPFGSLSIVFIRASIEVGCAASIYTVILLLDWKFLGHPAGAISALVNRFPDSIGRRLVW